jgi:hypothetical protein
MNWQEIVEFLGGAGLFATALGYVGKRAVDGFVAGRTEAYKSDLKRITTETHYTISTSAHRARRGHSRSVLQASDARRSTSFDASGLSSRW